MSGEVWVRLLGLPISCDTFNLIDLACAAFTGAACAATHTLITFTRSAAHVVVIGRVWASSAGPGADMQTLPRPTVDNHALGRRLPWRRGSVHVVDGVRGHVAVPHNRGAVLKGVWYRPIPPINLAMEATPAVVTVAAGLANVAGVRPMPRQTPRVLLVFAPLGTVAAGGQIFTAQISKS